MLAKPTRQFSSGPGQQPYTSRDADMQTATILLCWFIQEIVYIWNDMVDSAQLHFNGILKKLSRAALCLEI